MHRLKDILLESWSARTSAQLAAAKRDFPPPPAKKKKKEPTEVDRIFMLTKARHDASNKKTEADNEKILNPDTGNMITIGTALHMPATSAAHRAAVARRKSADENINELSPETYSSYHQTARTDKSDHVNRFNNGNGNDADEKNHFDKASKREKGIARSKELAAKKIKNPETGKEIKAASAKNPDHPAHSAYKSAAGINEDRASMLAQSVKYKNTDGSDGEGTVKSLLGYAKDHPGRKAAARVYAQFMGNNKSVSKAAYSKTTHTPPRKSNDTSRNRYDRGDDDDYDRRRDADAEDGVYKYEQASTADSTSLISMLKENAGNRIDTNKLKTIIGKIIPTLSEPKQEKLNEMFVEFLTCVFKVNSEPYGVFTSQAVKMEVFFIALKVEAMKDFLNKEYDAKKDNAKLIIVGLKALDELFEY